MSKGEHFNSDMVRSFGFDSFNNATPKQKKESAIKMKNKVIKKQDKENKVENISVKCGKQTKTFECPQSGGAESYIAVSTDISKKLVNDFKIPYKPAIMQKMLSIYRQKSSATDAITQLKDADKYIRKHKNEFIKNYEQAIEATEKSKSESESESKK